MLDRMPCHITDDPMSDPDYPRGVTLDYTRFLAVVLDDCGARIEFDVDAYDEASAVELAMQEARERGFQPAEIVSITENDE